MRLLILSLSALACLGAAEPGVSPRDWTQERLDRVLAAVGKAPGSVEVVLTDAPDLSTAARPDRLEVPRAAIALAPSTEAVDGLLAMLLSYAPEPKSERNKLTPLSALAFGALVAGTGGASDPSTGRDSKIIPWVVRQLVRTMLAKSGTPGRGEALAGMAFWGTAVRPRLNSFEKLAGRRR